jgi:hypothetical protein
MKATLYLPHETQLVASTNGLCLPDSETGFVQIPHVVSELLGCALGLVDVLASGPDYVAYSVFDCEGKANPTAMAAVAKVSGVSFDFDDEDALLRGPVLIVNRC